MSEHHRMRKDNKSLFEPQKDTDSLTQIMRVKAWVCRGEDAESNSLHTLVIVPRMSLSRESPEEPKPLHLIQCSEKHHTPKTGWGRA